MKQKDLLFILLSSTFLVAVWIIFSVLHNALTSTISENTAANIAPIPATFDTKTLTLLKKRMSIIPQNGIPLTPTPTPTPPPAPITPVSPLQSLSVPVASGGGTSK